MMNQFTKAVSTIATCPFRQCRLGVRREVQSFPEAPAMVMVAQGQVHRNTSLAHWLEQFRDHGIISTRPVL
jgi:hypothetical protein